MFDLVQLVLGRFGQMFFLVLVHLAGVLVDVEGFGVGLEDVLLVVQPAVAGEHIGHGDGQRHGHKPHSGEQLKA